jgi:branched-chain amino acid transport system ATP-binding protein
MTHALLEVKNLVVAYGPIVAVQDVSIRVEQGEIVALIGANGAGKSSLLNAIAGLVPPAAGQVVFAGKEVQKDGAERIVRSGLALVPEGRRVFPKLSVRHNLRLGTVALSDKSKRETITQRVLQLFPLLTDRSRQQAGTLSGGQQQMLAIGRALMSDPRILLLDEPSLGLAPIIVEEIFDLITQLRDEGMTILLVEQNVHRALEISDRAYVLAHGTLVREGSSSQLRSSADIERDYMGVGVSI